MTNEEKILLLLEKQGEQLSSIDNRLSNLETRFDNLETRFDNLETRVGNLEEASAITRDGVNALLQWAEECSETYKLPLPKVM